MLAGDKEPGCVMEIHLAEQLEKVGKRREGTEPRVRTVCLFCVLLLSPIP